ncbi:MAG: hypothetical protein M1830_005375 [Pleopsidium flavum]|nr:MAG: hypothetical protein M1830_005375 [Pleopsidium flavum]
MSATTTSTSTLLAEPLTTNSHGTAIAVGVGVGVPLGIIGLLVFGYLVYRDRKTKQRLHELHSQVADMSLTGSVYGERTSKPRDPPLPLNTVARTNTQHELQAREWAGANELPG